MGIVVKGKEVVAIYYGKIAVEAVYKGARLIWAAARSCFGKGYWIALVVGGNMEVKQ
jgi:nitric oxide synthase oxygenase domain/subunit